MELPAPSSDAYGGLSCVDAPAVVCDRVQELDAAICPLSKPPQPRIAAGLPRGTMARALLFPLAAAVSCSSVTASVHLHQVL